MKDTLSDNTMLENDSQDIVNITLYIETVLSHLKVGQDLSKELIARALTQLPDFTNKISIIEQVGAVAADMATQDPEYISIGGKCLSYTHQQVTPNNFLTAMKHCEYVGDRPYLSPEFMSIAQKYGQDLESMIVYERDFNFDYFGFQTLKRAYLLRADGQIVERPQHMYMRIALAIHVKDFECALTKIESNFQTQATIITHCLDLVQVTYNALSKHQYTHATPTMYSAGTVTSQMSSCFLIDMKNDSIEGIMDTAKECAVISKHAGGIGLSVSNIRASGSLIRGTNGTSNGIVPMLRVFNNLARYVDQGGGKRKGSIAVYLEPWHADIMDFLGLVTPVGDETTKARDLFLALWVSDLFWERVKANADWSLFCPDECPNLQNTWGDEHKALYTKYESQGKAKATIPASQLLRKIIEVQFESGRPYILNKDHCNRKSNQQHLGTIKSSNLCAEIIQYSDANETAVCNLASINLKAFVLKNKDNVQDAIAYDFKALEQVAFLATLNLNRVIDANYYPTEAARNSNTKHRPIGLGVQGFADALYLLKFAYESPEAASFNKNVFETIYHGSVRASIALAKQDGPYESWKGSLYSGELFKNSKSVLHEKCFLQFDLWEGARDTPMRYSDWDELKRQMRMYGLRNSLLTAVMPTASTSQIMGNYEGIELPQSNVYKRSTLAGSFVVINRYLVSELMKLSLWNDSMRTQLIANNGSVQSLNIPDDIKARYKTAWEMKQKHTIDMAAQRGRFIDQSQSMNLYMETTDTNRVFNALYYGWTKGLKTGMYYLRSKPASNAIKYSVSPVNLPPSPPNVPNAPPMPTPNVSIQESSNEGCEMCSG